MVPPPRGITLDWPPRFSAPAVHEITHALLGGREGDRHGKEFRVKLREIGGGLIQVTFIAVARSFHLPRPGQYILIGVIFGSILNRAPIPIVRWNPDVPPRLEQIIQEALEKERTLHYQHASDIRADLLRLKRDTASGSASPSISDQHDQL